MSALPLVLFMALVIPRLTLAEQPAVLFPRPPELKEAVEFWKRVFAVYGTDHAVVHDSENLAVIYGVEGLGSRADSGRDRERKRAQRAILARYQRALERFANGQADTSRLFGDDLRVWTALGKTTDRLRYRRALETLRLQVGQRDRFERGLIASELYLEEIRRILRSHGVSDSLAVLPFVESAFNVRAYSKAGAAGLWQITRPAGRRFLTINRRVDERRDPLKSTRAAARILKENHTFLGTWPLAITAYNHGLGGVARAVKTLGTRDIAAIIRRYRGKRFGFASRNFYPEFLAALDVIHNRQEYYGGLPAPPLAEDLIQTQGHGQGRR